MKKGVGEVGKRERESERVEEGDRVGEGRWLFTLVLGIELAAISRLGTESDTC